jgi:hypothetical protein
MVAGGHRSTNLVPFALQNQGKLLTSTPPEIRVPMTVRNRKGNEAESKDERPPPDRIGSAAAG